MKNLKIYKKAGILLMAGVVTLSGYKKTTDKDIIRQHTVEETDDTNDKSISIVSNKKVKEIQKPKPGTFYVTKKVSLLKKTSNSKVICKIKPYQKVKILNCEGKWTLVKYGKNNGYIRNKNIEKIQGKYIEVDISKQKLKIYKNEKKILETKVVTGLATDSNRKTVTGCFSVYSKERNRTLVGKEYKTPVKYWMPFYKAYGMHDAYWRSKFGGKIYKSSGSHGCVNLPKEVAPKVYKKINVGTPVLIHN